jgi:hypothetical protein
MGISAANFAAINSTAFPNFIAALGYTDIINETGINDLTQGRTQTPVLADRQNIFGRFSGTSRKRGTLTPRSTSSNGYADVAGQQPKTDGNMAALNSVNAAIRADEADTLETFSHTRQASKYSQFNGAETALTEILAPGTKLAAVILALSSGLHRRRRTPPTITSTRRGPDRARSASPCA